MKKLNLQIVRCIVSIVIIFAAVIIFSSAANAQQSKEDFFNGVIADVTKEIAAKPKDDKLYVKRGEYYLNLQEKFKEALADANRALKINPKNAGAVKLRAAALKAEKDYDEIFSELGNFDFDFSNSSDDKKTSDLSKRIAADPYNSDLRVERGENYLQDKNLSEALADAELALLLRPSNSYAMLLRSDIKLAKKDKTGSDADFRQAVKLREKSSIVGRIVSHSGKTLTGIVVLGKSLGDPFGYASIEEAKKDYLEIGTKVLVKDKATGKILVFQGIAALDSKENVIRAETEFRPNLHKEDGIMVGYEYLKIATDQSLLLPKKDRVSAALNDDVFVVDILDYANLSLVRRQPLPLAAGDKAFENLMDSEIATRHFDEAKAIYLYLEKKYLKPINLQESKMTRKLNLGKLYKTADVNLQKFVEQEIKKYNYTPEEIRSIKYPPFFV